MLVLTFEDDIPLVHDRSALDVVRRFSIKVSELGEHGRMTIGSAQAVLVRYKESQRRGVSMHRALEADSLELGALYPFIFARGGLLGKHYGDWERHDAIYIESLELVPEWRGQQIEEAVAHRVFEEWGRTCAVGVMRVPRFPQRERWLAAGFELVVTGGMLFLVQDLAWSRPHAIEVQQNVYQIQDEIDDDHDDANSESAKGITVSGGGDQADVDDDDDVDDAGEVNDAGDTDEGAGPDSDARDVCSRDQYHLVAEDVIDDWAPGRAPRHLTH